MKSVEEQGFFHDFAFENEMLLKHLANFESVENIRSSNVVELELPYISICLLTYL